jgi:hypothetical protein
MGTRALSLWVQRAGHEAEHSPPSSAEVKEWVDLYLHSANTPSWRRAQLKGAQKQLHLHFHLLYSHTLLVSPSECSILCLSSKQFFFNIHSVYISSVTWFQQVNLKHLLHNSFQLIQTQLYEPDEYSNRYRNLGKWSAGLWMTISTGWITHLIDTKNGVPVDTLWVCHSLQKRIHITTTKIRASAYSNKYTSVQTCT